MVKTRKEETNLFVFVTRHYVPPPYLCGHCVSEKGITSLQNKVRIVGEKNTKLLFSITDDLSAFERFILASKSGKHKKHQVRREQLVTTGSESRQHLESSMTTLGQHLKLSYSQSNGQ